MIKKTILFFGLTAAISILTPQFVSAEETVIKENDGSTTVVKTDSQGTQVSTDGKTVYFSGEDRHKDQVEYSLKHGGTVKKNNK